MGALELVKESSEKSWKFIGVLSFFIGIFLMKLFLVFNIKYIDFLKESNINLNFS